MYARGQIIQLESQRAPGRVTPFDCTFLSSQERERLSQVRPRGPGPLRRSPRTREAKAVHAPASFGSRVRTGSANSGLGAQHRSRCGPRRRAENGRAGAANQRTPTERRAAARPISAAPEGKGRELREPA